MQNLQSALGVFVVLALACLASERRNAIAWKRVFAALALTFLLALLLLKVPALRAAFAAVNSAVEAVAAATRAGTTFVFGYLGGGPQPFDPKTPASTFILAFQALPIVLVVSVLTTLLFYWRVLPPIVRGFSFLLERTLGVGGAVGLSTAANVFVGMVEAPLFIRPYLARLSRSELFVVMTGGMAGIAGTVLVLYATVLAPVIPDAAGHFVVASVLGAPAAILVAQIMVPESEESRTSASESEPEVRARSTMDAIVSGTAAGLELLLNICAMLIVLVALVHLVNTMLSTLPAIGGTPLSLERALGWLMAPLCWTLGVSWQEAFVAGELMGQKTVLNELVAYLRLAEMPAEALSPRSRLIMLYALCGFANFGSLGIMIAGLGTMAPERRADVVALGPKSIVSGTLATCLLGAIVGVLT